METIPASHRDLLDAQVATLATVGANGRPQQSIVWFLAEGDTVRYHCDLHARRRSTKTATQPAACSASSTFWAIAHLEAQPCRAGQLPIYLARRQAQGSTTPYRSWNPGKPWSPCS